MGVSCHLIPHALVKTFGEMPAMITILAEVRSSLELGLLHREDFMICVRSRLVEEFHTPTIGCLLCENETNSISFLTYTRADLQLS